MKDFSKIQRTINIHFDILNKSVSSQDWMSNYKVLIAYLQTVNIRDISMNVIRNVYCSTKHPVYKLYMDRCIDTKGILTP